MVCNVKLERQTGRNVLETGRQSSVGHELHLSRRGLRITGLGHLARTTESCLHLDAYSVLRGGSNDPWLFDRATPYLPLAISGMHHLMLMRTYSAGSKAMADRVL